MQPLAEPARRVRRAAKAVEVDADDVARAARLAVVRQRQQLLVGVGVGRQPDHGGAEVAHRAQRCADAANLRVAHQLERIGRPGHANVDRHLGLAPRQVGAERGDARGRERKLRHHIHAEILCARDRELAAEGLLEHRGRDAAMALGITGQADFANPDFAEHTVFEHLQRVGVGAAGSRFVAGDQHHPVRAVCADRERQKFLQLDAAGEAPRGNVRDRVEPGTPDRRHRGERFCERPRCRRRHVDAGVDRQHLGDALDLGALARRNLDRRVGEQLAEGRGQAGCGGGSLGHAIRPGQVGPGQVGSGQVWREEVRVVERERGYLSIQ